MVATQDEIRRAIEALTRKEHRHLLWLARQFATPIGLLATGRQDEDFVHEAIALTLSGSRRWNKNFLMRDHLKWVIKSVVSNHAQHHNSQRYQEPLLLSSLNSEGDGDLDLEGVAKTADDFPSALLNPEEELELKQRQLILDKVRGQMAEILGQHSMGWKIFQLRMEGVSGPEIRRELTIVKRQYDAYNMQIVRAMSKIRKCHLKGML